MSVSATAMAAAAAFRRTMIAGSPWASGSARSIRSNLAKAAPLGGGARRPRYRWHKVLADPETREILGCHILGTDASTLVQGVATLMRAGETVDAVRRAIFVHPALPEVVQRAFGELDLE